MNKLAYLSGLLLVTALSPAFAKTVYVTDEIEFTLRVAEDNRSKILKMIPSGTPLTVLEAPDEETGYTFVRFGEDVEGYVITRYLLNKPTNKWYLEQAQKKLTALKTSTEKSRTELKSLKSDKSSADSSNKSLTRERNKLSKELTELKHTAANAIQLKQQRDQLQERVVTVERELQKVKRDNQALTDSTNQDWFLYGGALSLFGVIMGFILPKISWRRKTSWDTF